MKQLPITLTIKSPVVLTALSNAGVMTETKDFFSGTVLRGALASRVIHNRHLGKEAHLDSVFMDLFYGELAFVDAYPTTLVEGLQKRAIPVPASLQKVKAGADTSGHEPIVDTLVEKQPLPNYKSLKGFGIFDKDTFVPVEVETSIALHMSREHEIERLSGSSKDGNIYNYESIEPNQVFKGYIIGPEETLNLLVQELALDKNRMTCRMGRSKFTGYGQCQLDFGPVEDLAQVTGNENTIHLRLETPMIPIHSINSSLERAVAHLLETLQAVTGSSQCKLNQEESFAKFEAVDNFVATWGLKRPTQYAISAGSIITIQKDSPWSQDELAALENICYRGFGQRCQEGFGQLRPWQPVNCQMQEPSVEVTTPEMIHDSVKIVVCHILEQRLATELHNQARRDLDAIQDNLQKAGKSFSEYKHSFAYLESLLGDRTDISGHCKKFREKVQENIDKQRLLSKNIRHIKIHGDSLDDILFNPNKYPFDLSALDTIIDTELAQKVGFTIPSKTSDFVYYEYWLWFFRHGRKKGVSQ